MKLNAGGISSADRERCGLGETAEIKKKVVRGEREGGFTSTQKRESCEVGWGVC